MSDQLQVVGKRVPMIDGPARVTASAQYTQDVVLPGMLYGKILRSPHAHARILRLDTSRAEQLSGVRAVITAADTSGLTYIHLGPPLADKYPLAKDKVRYMGDEVAAVAAEDPETAARALELVEVEYEILPAVFTVEEAMAPGAPQVHASEGNVAVHIIRHFGDVEQGFRQADFVFEDEYSTPAIAHCCLETHGVVAAFDEKGYLTLWAATQAPYFIKKELSHVLQMPDAHIRVMAVQLGGGFGARSKVCDDEAICALLAKKSGRPVKITLSREEEFATTRTRHPTRIRIKTGVKSDGTLVARELVEFMDNGAYNGYGPAILSYSASVVASLYRVPNVRFEGYLVYTNKQYGGPMRGYGAPQVTFAVESQMDRIARQLGMDRVALRTRNANRPDEVTPCGWKITSCAFAECIEQAVASLGARKEKHGTGARRRGVGVAGGIGVSGSHVYVDGDYTGAVVELTPAGTVTVKVGTTDLGTWSNTTLAQVAAEELGVALEDVRMVVMDTALTPPDPGSFGSRVAFVGGNAVRRAAAIVKRKILEAMANKIEVSVDLLEARNRMIHVAGSKEPVASVYQAAQLTADFVEKGAVTASYRYETPTDLLDRATGYGNVSAAYCFLAQAAEVEVDCETGRVQVLQLSTVYDVGRALNPTAVEGQIQGAVIMGAGFALTEQLKYDQGRLLNSNFLDYRLLTACDIPELKVILLEQPDPEGPFGAKGVGEWALVPTAPAIANAVYDAIGVQVHDLPITPERVLQSQSKQSPSQNASQCPGG